MVHGGDRYVKSTVITEEVEAGIEALAELAPLHNPAWVMRSKPGHAGRRKHRGNGDHEAKESENRWCGIVRCRAPGGRR